MPRSAAPGGVTLWRNLGDGRFEDVTAKAGLSGHTGWTLDVGHADLNNDGFQDVYVASDYGTDRLFIGVGSMPRFARLAQAGQPVAHIDLDQLRGYLRDHPGGGLELPNRALTLDSVVRNFRIILLGENRARRELRVQLETQTPEHAPDEPESLDSRPFTVGFFDFPMIDNTRLSRDQRCAIVINALDDHNADISLVYFHGSRASLREKPYYEEVVQRLVGSTAPGITSGYHRR